MGSLTFDLSHPLSPAQLAPPTTVLCSEVPGAWATEHHTGCHVCGGFNGVAGS